jgi:hypothetical protein
MDRASLAAKAREHWAKWLPEKTAELKASGELNEAIQVAATNAQRMISGLMAENYKEHEAEEMALARYILLKPEPEPSDWESDEADEAEARYQELMREPDEDE